MTPVKTPRGTRIHAVTVLEERALSALWQTRVNEALYTFLATIQQMSNFTSQASVLISYVPDRALVDSSAEMLAHCLTKAGLSVTLAALQNADLLRDQLDNKTHAILFCTPAYATSVKAEPAIFAQLEAFGQTKKNALQP